MGSMKAVTIKENLKDKTKPVTLIVTDTKINNKPWYQYDFKDLDTITLFEESKGKVI